MSFRRVFVHGAGRRGTDAWPTMTSEGAAFVSFPPDSDVASQTEVLVASHFNPDSIVYAHSIGAVPAVLAAGRAHVAGLVLVEPALYDIARGEAAIERHIDSVTDAHARAAIGDLRGFWAILRPLMFGGPFDPDRWDMEEPLARRWATSNVPWGHGVRPGMIDGIPTLVITGRWNNEYELIAERLLEHGARHEVLPGAAHRPQDLPGFNELVRAFEASLA